MIYYHPGRVRRRRVEKLLSHGQMMMMLFITAAVGSAQQQQQPDQHLSAVSTRRIVQARACSSASSAPLQRPVLKMLFNVLAGRLLSDLH